LVVRWPAGGRQVVVRPRMNSVVKVTEAGS